MSTEIRVNGVEAVFHTNPNRWVSEDEVIEEMLNNLLPVRGFSTAVPNKGAFAVSQAVDTFAKVEIIEVDPTPEIDPEVLY